MMDKAKLFVTIVRARDLGANAMPVEAQGQKNAIHAGAQVK